MNTTKRLLQMNYHTMLGLCNNPKSQGYKSYGAKGISVADIWAETVTGFENYYSWAISNGYAPGKIIIRKDTSNEFSPDNCQILTKEQYRQYRNNKFFEHYGVEGLSKCQIKFLRQVRRNILDRCYNPKCPNFRRYGGRGITVCDEWKNPETGLINFLKWAKANKYKLGLTVDRINNDGNYEPANCQFLTKSENARKGNKIMHLMAVDNMSTCAVKMN